MTTAAEKHVRQPLSKADIYPYDDQYVVEPVEAEEYTPGGIALPPTARGVSQRGRVLAAGPGRVLENGDRSPMSVGVGDLVLFGKWAGHNVETDDCKDLKVLREHDLLARLTE